MSEGTRKIYRREIRKALRPAVADLVEQHQVRLMAHAQILRGSLWRRLKWLILGR